NQDLGLLRPEEAADSLKLPPWLRVLWRKHHPDGRYLASDPTGGYPLLLRNLHQWMITPQDLQPGKAPAPAPAGAAPKSAGESGEQRISGAQTTARSESTIRVNRSNTQQIVAASNNLAFAEQAQFYSADNGSTWGQTY